MSNWLFRLLMLVLAALSGPLREELVKFAKEFREKARKTENPWDDVVADILCWLLQID